MAAILKNGAARKKGFKLSPIMLHGQQIGIKDGKKDQRSSNFMSKLKISCLETLAETDTN